MNGAIFISYRRDDSPHAAGRLYDHLAQSFSRDQLFMDIDAIEPGLDFLKVIKEKVTGCEVLLAVIGPKWSAARNEDGTRRLDDPNDFVRLEIEAALERDVRVIPVLVDGAPIPKASELPETLQSLVRRNAIHIAHDRFAADATGLVAALKRATIVRNKGQQRGFWASLRSSGSQGPVFIPKPPLVDDEIDELPKPPPAVALAGALADEPSITPKAAQPVFLDEFLNQVGYALLGYFIAGVSATVTAVLFGLLFSQNIIGSGGTAAGLVALIASIGARVFYSQRKFFDIAAEGAVVCASEFIIMVLIAANYTPPPYVSAKDFLLPMFIGATVFAILICIGLSYLKARKNAFKD
jgi:hypothetical protein